MFCTATPLPLASLLVDSCCSSGSVDVDRRACCTPGNLPNTGPLLAEPRPHCRIHYLVVRTTVHPAGLLLASIAPSSRECQCRCVGCCVPFFSGTPAEPAADGGCPVLGNRLLRALPTLPRPLFTRRRARNPRAMHPGYDSRQRAPPNAGWSGLSAIPRRYTFSTTTVAILCRRKHG